MHSASSRQHAEAAHRTTGCGRCDNVHVAETASENAALRIAAGVAVAAARFETRT